MAEAGQDIGSKGSSGWLLVFLFAVPLLYVLSIGPAVALIIRAQDQRIVRVFERIYAPVIWLHDHTLLKEPLEAYVESWGDEVKDDNSRIPREAKGCEPPVALRPSSRAKSLLLGRGNATSPCLSVR